jgi:hypothetical protein
MLASPTVSSEDSVVFSSDWGRPMPRDVTLLDRDGAGVVAGDTRLVMMLKEFILRKERKPWGIER